MARKVDVVIAEDAAEEFFRRAHEHARALDRGEKLLEESTVIVEEAGTLVGVKKVHRAIPVRSVTKKRAAIAR